MYTCILPRKSLILPHLLNPFGNKILKIKLYKNQTVKISKYFWRGEMTNISSYCASNPPAIARGRLISPNSLFDSFYKLKLFMLFEYCNEL